jgi:mRNA interferase RelE/StbE
MYQILLHPLANNFLMSLDNSLQAILKKKIMELQEFPGQRGKHLTHSKFWSLRVGDYRAIYEIKEKDKKIIILFLGHRKDVYDDFSKLF